MVTRLNTVQNNQVLSRAGDLYQPERPLQSTYTCRDLHLDCHTGIFLLYFYILFNCQQSRSADLNLILAGRRPFWANYLSAGAQSQRHIWSMATDIQDKWKKEKKSFKMCLADVSHPWTIFSSTCPVTICNWFKHIPCTVKCTCIVLGVCWVCTEQVYGPSSVTSTSCICRLYSLLFAVAIETRGSTDHLSLPAKIILDRFSQAPFEAPSSK